MVAPLPVYNRTSVRCKRRNMVSLREENFEIKLPMFNESIEKDLHLFELRVKAASRGRDWSEAHNGEVVENIVTQKALSIITSGLEDNRLRTIQDCETAHGAWIKL